MNKISSRQAFSLILVISFFNIMCSSTPYSAEYMGGFLISAVIQSLLLIPVIWLYNQQDFSLETIPRWVTAIYTLYFILYGGFAFSTFYTIASGMNFPVSNHIFAVILIASVCLYSAYLGIKAVSRGSVIIAFIFIASLIFLLIGAYSKADINRVAFDSAKEMFATGFSNFIFSSELAVIFIILALIKNNRAKCVYSFIMTKLVIAVFITFAGTAVLGSISNITDFPFFALSSYSQPFSVQRADSIYIMLFTMICALSIALFIIISSMLIRIIYPKMKYNELLVTLAMLAVSLLFSKISEFAGLIWIVFSVVLYIGIPFFLIGGDKNEKISN